MSSEYSKEKYATKSHYLKYKYSGGRNMKRAFQQDKHDACERLNSEDIACNGKPIQYDVSCKKHYDNSEHEYDEYGILYQHPLKSAHATKEYYHLRRKIPKLLDISLNPSIKNDISEKLFGIESSDKTKKKMFSALLQESDELIQENITNKTECNSCKTYSGRYNFIKNVNL